VGRAVFEYDTSAKHRSELLAEVAQEIYRKFRKKDRNIIVRQRSPSDVFQLDRSVRSA